MVLSLAEQNGRDSPDGQRLNQQLRVLRGEISDLQDDRSSLLAQLEDTEEDARNMEESLLRLQRALDCAEGIKPSSDKLQVDCERVERGVQQLIRHLVIDFGFSRHLPSLQYTPVYYSKCARTPSRRPVLGSHHLA